MIRVAIALAVASLLTLASAARAAPPPVEDYGRLPAMSLVALSPSGDRYAFVARDGEARKLFIVTADKKPLVVLDVGAAKVESLSWAGENYVLVEISTTVGLSVGFIVQKQELISAIAINLQTGKQLTIFHGQDKVDTAIGGYYGTKEIDNRWYGFFGGYTLLRDRGGEIIGHANEENTAGSIHMIPDLYRVDLESGALKKIVDGEFHDDGWLVGPQGDVLARELYDERSGHWEVKTGGRGGRVIVSGDNKLGDADLLGLGRTADAILVRHNDDKGMITEEWPLAGGPTRPALGDISTDELIRDPATDLWIGTTADGDEPVSSLFSPLFEARLKGARNAFPGYRVQLKSWSTDFGRMIVFTDGGDDSGTYWLVDIALKSAVPLGAAYPTVTPADVGPVKMVDWKAADGLALRGVLTLPPGREAKNLPLVVMPHGGPWARDYPGFHYWAQAFASRGYAVFQPNFRASIGYAGGVYEAGYGQVGRKMQTDISDGVAALAGQGVVDPKRVCIVGGSYGGYAALAGVTIQHGLYRCAVSVAGVSDFTRWLEYLGEETGGAETSDMRNWLLFLGAKSNWAELAPISPAKLADRADAPILLIHGKDDTVVPIAQSDEMEHALKAAGKPVERVTLAGADHHLLHEDTRMAMLRASVAFVQKYNPADASPAAAINQDAPAPK